MLLGIIFIAGGLLIAIFPQILSLIVAFFLIFLGISVMYMGYYYRRNARKFDDPFIDFFFRL
ncbi:MAG: DUF3096 domain-containing protein [Candidatus Omnitrophica bacterium]|nr:DUF3096 domain-containing protein [Candidatus Omnitrophota bacterium]MBD3268853.1 DUF3096 domain-containing protein [Candidatus Omnitrophota bacterium]